MPSAVPVPGGPSVLLLGSSAGLLTAPGCPACRYVAESSSTYLAWFALEGHADPDALRRVCASGGMCARHTRRLLAQPGAAFRLTAVYRYVVAAAARDLAADATRQAPGCPACDQEAGAQDRVLSTLLENFTAEARGPYREHGGLCLPHLRRAARRYRSQDLRWLIRLMITRLRAPGPDLDLLAGWRDPGASPRAAHRAWPAGSSAAWAAGQVAACRVCWSAAHAEAARLAVVGSAGRGRLTAPTARSLCGLHLRDAAAAGDPPTGEAGRLPAGQAGRLPAGQAGRLSASQAGDMLAAQAEGEARRLSQVLDSRPRLLGISPGWLAPRARRAVAEPDCAVCRAKDDASASEITRIRALLREGAGQPGQGLPLCVRHAASLRAADAQAARPVLRALRQQADQLVAELDAEFTVQAGARARAQRAGTRYPELTAWRRAAVFLDGSVLGGRAAD